MPSVTTLAVLFLTACFPSVTGSTSKYYAPLPFDVAINITGGSKDQFHEHVLDRIQDYAYTLKNDTPNYLDHIEDGLHGFAIRFRFNDNVTWAAKIAGNTYWQNNDMRNAMKALKLLERYCPQIPVPRVHGGLRSLANGSLIYYLTDWIQGTTLEEDSKYIRTSLNKTMDGKMLFNVTLPDGLVSQLTQFMYNVTTCPIPERERDPISRCG
jgi:hypothetical protein